MGKRIIEELATDTIQDNDFILMDNNTTPTDPDDDTAGTRKMRAKEFGAQIITVDDELSTSSENPVQNKVITDAINDLASATEITGTASGSIASFDDGSELPLKTLQVSIEPVQSGSGEPSPENVRPISGWDGANVGVYGANLWDEEWEQGVITSGEKVPNTSCIRSKNYISVKPNKTYYLYCGSATNQYFIRPVFYDLEKHYIENGAWCANGTFTTPDNCYYIYLTTQTASSAQYGGTYNNDISINYPSTDTSYHAYNGHTYPISWQTQCGIVYGGNFKLFKDGGKWYCTVTADKVKYTPTTSDTLGGYVHTSNNGWAFTLNNSPSLKVGGDVISNINVPTAYTVTTNDGFCKVAVNKVIFFLSDSNNNLSADSSNSDIKNAFDTFVTNYSPQAVYELATPQTYQLTPTAVASILGVNNVSVDTGNVLACEYVKDTDIVIKKLLYKDLTATLSANATSLTITDSAITTDATYDIFTDTYGVSPTAVSVSNGSMTLTFTARGSATKVKVRVML